MATLPTSIEWRSSLRYLWRHRTASLAVVLTWAGGLTAALTTVVVASSVLTRPLPFPEADRLVLLWETSDAGDTGTPRRVSGARFAEWRDQLSAVDRIAAFGASSLSLDAGDGRRELRGLRVTGQYFAVLGVSPQLGRGLGADDERPGAPSTVVLSHELWTSAFGARPEVIGTAARFGDEVRTIVGVMPAIVSPAWPGNPATVSIDVDQRQFWVAIPRTSQFETARGHVLGVVARLGAGTTLEGARAALSRPAPPSARDAHAGVVTPYREQFVRAARAPLTLLLVAVCAVLLTVGTNLAGLQAAAFERRRREFSVRAALGASRWRTVHPLLAESMVLTTLGAAAGVAATKAVLAWLPAQLPPSIPLLSGAALDATAIVVAGGLTGVLALVLCVWPILRLKTAAPSPRGVASGVGAPVFRGLVIAQVTLTVVLVSAAALLGISLRNVYAQPAGFALDHRLTADIQLPSTVDTPDGVIARLAEVGDAVRRVPGVRDVAWSYDHPLAANWSGAFTLVGDAPTTDGPSREAELRIVSPSYFAVAGTRVIEGRTFADQDDATRAGVALVNAAMARRIAGVSLGRRFLTGEPRSWGPAAPAEVTVVGVVEDERFGGLEAASRPAVYLSTGQFPQNRVSLLVRTSGDPEVLGAAVRTAASRAVPGLIVARVATLDQIAADQLAPRRTTTGVVVAFSLGALALAALGLHGLMAVIVDHRRREFGLRMALGASPAALARGVVARALRWTAIGVVAGTLMSFVTGRMLSGLLVGIRSSEPAAMLIVAAVLMVMAIAATLAPALHAARVDPVTSLKAD